MADAGKYIVDDSGKIKSVLFPNRQWESRNANYTMLQKKLEVFANIRNGLKEVHAAQKSGRKLQTLKEFLKGYLR